MSEQAIWEFWKHKKTHVCRIETEILSLQTIFLKKIMILGDFTKKNLGCGENLGTYLILLSCFLFCFPTSRVGGIFMQNKAEIKYLLG